MQLGTGLVVTAACSFHTVSQVWIARDVLTMAQPSHIPRTNDHDGDHEEEEVPPIKRIALNIHL
jgi:hypothetical protein